MSVLMAQACCMAARGLYMGLGLHTATCMGMVVAHTDGLRQRQSAKMMHDFMHTHVHGYMQQYSFTLVFSIAHVHLCMPHHMYHAASMCEPQMHSVQTPHKGKLQVKMCTLSSIFDVYTCR